MSFLSVQHTTVYRYREPVTLGEHRMMFRPRESHDLRLIRTSLVITPRPTQIRWVHDAFDNSVAIATFEGKTTLLCFQSDLTIEHFESAQPQYAIEDYARSYPFRYTDDDFPNLMPGLTLRYPSPEVNQWALNFLDNAPSTDTMKILRAMTRRIRDDFSYVRRPEKGVQPPGETLSRRRGSCRDFALLMIEACRNLGIAARFVSGYIYTPNTDSFHGGGATHGWMQAYLPGAGWVDFDPTNSIVGNRNLIRVAVAWTPDHALPLCGTFWGRADAFERMDVEVHVDVAADEVSVA